MSPSKIEIPSSGVGYEFPPIPVGWLKRDLLVYSNSIGVRHDELQFLYELHPDFQAFPSYPVILSRWLHLQIGSMWLLTISKGFKEADQDVIPFISRPSPAPVPGGPPLDPASFVDGERHIRILKKIPTSAVKGQFELRNKCLDIQDKGKPGTVLIMQHQLVEKATNEVYAEVQCSTFAVGQGNWGGPRGPRAVPYAPPAGASPTATVTTTTSLQQALLYR